MIVPASSHIFMQHTDLVDQAVSGISTKLCWSTGATLVSESLAAVARMFRCQGGFG